MSENGKVVTSDERAPQTRKDLEESDHKGVGFSVRVGFHFSAPFIRLASCENYNFPVVAASLAKLQS